VEGESFEGEETQERNGQLPRGNPELVVRSCKGRKAPKQVKLAERGDSAELSPGRRGNELRLVETKSIVVGKPRQPRESVDVGETSGNKAKHGALQHVGG
jgi:hypothetical protein